VSDNIRQMSQMDDFYTKSVRENFLNFLSYVYFYKMTECFVIFAQVYLKNIGDIETYVNYGYSITLGNFMPISYANYSKSIGDR